MSTHRRRYLKIGYAIFKPLMHNQNQSQSYFTTDRLLPISLSWRQAPWYSRPAIFCFQLQSCGHSPNATSSLTRGWVYRSQLLLGLANAVILRSESRGTHDHILLPQIRGSSNLEDQVPVFISPRNRVAHLYPQSLGSFEAQINLNNILKFSSYLAEHIRHFQFKSQSIKAVSEGDRHVFWES
jgi:hypothetical protein